MGIFSRLADIINSNLSAALARAEDPEKMIRLMIQEMEETLVEVRSTAARLIADRKGALRSLSRIRDAQDGWRRKAELALERGREDLAKGALLEKAKLVETADALEHELGQLDDSLVRYEEDIAKLETKLREAKAKQKAMQARQASASARVRVKKQIHDRRLDDAFVRFEQMERRVDATEGMAESYEIGGKPDAGGRTLADEIASLEAERAIEHELAELRARAEARKTRPEQG